MRSWTKQKNILGTQNLFDLPFFILEKCHRVQLKNLRFNLAILFVEMGEGLSPIKSI
jgi:hypothetical protein